MKINKISEQFKRLRIVEIVRDHFWVLLKSRHIKDDCLLDGSASPPPPPPPLHRLTPIDLRFPPKEAVSHILI